jgi:L-ascorbate metabolism protein UlaG (beta-lactamase superfamily)
VLEGEQKKVYFAGDTAYFEGFKEIGRRFPDIDAALLPIGAYDPEWFMRVQHMNPEDAVNAFKSLSARLLCAMHWGTFKLTDEPLDEPPRLLEEVRQREHVPREKVWVAAIGESRPL